MEGCYGTTDLTTALEMETLPLPQTAHFERRAAIRKNVGPQGAGFLSSPTVHKSGEGRFLLRFWCLLIGMC